MKKWSSVKLTTGLMVVLVATLACMPIQPPSPQTALPAAEQEGETIMLPNVVYTSAFLNELTTWSGELW